MKKMLIAGLAVLVVASALLAQMTGSIFSQEVDKLSVQLEKDPRIQVLTQEQESGWFASQGKITVSFVLDSQHNLVVTNHWQARHRPGWVSYQGDTFLHSLDAEESSLDLLEGLGIESLPFSGRAGWRKASYQLELEAVSWMEKDLSVDFSGGQLDADYVYASGQQTGHLTADFLTLASGQFNPSKLRFDGLSLAWGQQGVYPWVSGEMHGSMEQLHFQGPQGELRFDQPSISQNLAMSEKAFDLRVDFDSGSVGSGDRSLGQLAFSLHTDRFNGQAMADLLTFFSEEADWEAVNEEAMQPALSAFNRLLEGSPGIVLEKLAVDLARPIEISQKAGGSLYFDGRNLPENYLNRVSSGELAEDDLMKRLSLELVFDQIDSELLMLIGIPAFLQDESKAQQQLTWEGGELRLNGQRLPF